MISIDMISQIPPLLEAVKIFSSAFIGGYISFIFAMKAENKKRLKDQQHQLYNKLFEMKDIAEWLEETNNHYSVESVGKELNLKASIGVQRTIASDFSIIYYLLDEHNSTQL